MKSAAQIVLLYLSIAACNVAAKVLPDRRQPASPQQSGAIG
ncbi:predicted protein [Plenodomus lingam JN3]|uniref:Predicted protein n=1 Tax=Leptosphaeria maculans (strain JN3 / isolate v23.1.3 / race Av1-4-5-6-7-8) TaxID=985895 RepID=E5AC99_LEPMJ|nr:predicted protein [Plenodomus lingam JN3]CBY02101.1 predicted protein [Plenodomus lingam JN3]